MLAAIYIARTVRSFFKLGEEMKNMVAALMVALIVAPALGQKPCEELKSEIVQKLEAKGVKNYQLVVVANQDVKDQKVVGSCELGTKKIVYSRTAEGGTAGRPAPTPPAQTKH